MARPKEKHVQVYLSRRNLLTLLSKLDRAEGGENTFGTVIKSDIAHKQYPQSHDKIWVTAVEDADYYTDREPGIVAPIDEQRMAAQAEENTL